MKITDQTTIRELEDALEREGFSSMEMSIGGGAFIVKLKHHTIGKTFGHGASLSEAVSVAYKRHLDEIEALLKEDK